ncbi:MAG: DNA repair protein RecO [Deltaproteobacteria bacterium]|nr:DNA repair protein RecO [Deltaproteobacteria bacterium]
MAELVTDAIVLRRVDFGDADLILTLFTRSAGKLSALGRAARKSRRRFGGALGSFTRSQATLRRRPRSDLWTLTSAMPVKTYDRLALDVTALAHASYATELVRELVASEVEEPEIFDLLIDLYEQVAAAGGRPPLLRAFELALLRHVGVEPVFEACSSCGRDRGDFEAGAIFDPAAGGIACRKCAARSLGLGVRPLSDAALERLVEYAAVGSLEQAAGLDPRAEGAGEARDTMIAIIRNQVPGQLKSLEFVSKMNAQAPGNT